ncbi:MAG: hypothetical protein KGL46_05005 [Hyphomicrobiales bacterium]|nr:hypothetical protein [Hyphomicrobiales bacterium]
MSAPALASRALSGAAIARALAPFAFGAYIASFFSFGVLSIFIFLFSTLLAMRVASALFVVIGHAALAATIAQAFWKERR